MAVKFSNNASGTIASSINSTTTTIVLTSGQGSLFPSLGASDYFFATLVDSSNNLEIVKVTARSTDTMTVVRGQDGTSGRSYTAGDRFELRPVAAAFNGIQAEIDALETAVAATYAPLASPAFTGVPTAPTASAGTNTTQVATTAFVITNGVPAGAILLWSGSVASVPSGWNLCDGTNGTPDLRNRFVVGAGSTYTVGGTGGSADAIVVAHTHTATSTSTVTDPGHAHSINLQVEATAGGGRTIQHNGSFAGTFNTNSNTTGISVATTTTNASTGSSGTNANLPPYYALAYIMKL